MVELLSPSNSSVPSTWLRRPTIAGGDEVCLFVTYAPAQSIPQHSIFHARSWADAGFSVIVIITCDELSLDIDHASLDFAAGVLLRLNRGYDFGAWASALVQLPAIRKASLLALVNDSLFGPLNTFESFLRRVRATDADMVGTTESLQFARHFQSFMLFFKAGALNNSGFWQFWKGVRAGGRLVAIYRYELGILPSMERVGLRCEALFKAVQQENSTLSRWKELIEEGFPFVKIAALRENFCDVDRDEWSRVLLARGYNPDLAYEYLDRRSSLLERWLARYRL